MSETDVWIAYSYISDLFYLTIFYILIGGFLKWLSKAYVCNCDLLNAVTGPIHSCFNLHNLHVYASLSLKIYKKKKKVNYSIFTTVVTSFEVLRKNLWFHKFLLKFEPASYRLMMKHGCSVCTNEERVQWSSFCSLKVYQELKSTENIQNNVGKRF